MVIVIPGYIIYNPHGKCIFSATIVFKPDNLECSSLDAFVTIEEACRNGWESI